MFPTGFAALIRRYIPLAQITEFIGVQTCKLQCYATYALDVPTWTAAGGLEAFCRRKCEIITVRELGCTECYQLSSESLRALNPPLSVGTVRLEIDMPEGKEYCIGGECWPVSPAKAANLSIRVYDKPLLEVAKGEIRGRCANGECGDIRHEYVPFTNYGDFLVLCKREETVKVSSTLTYGYEVSGRSSIVIQQAGVAPLPAIPEPITTPGPLKLAVKPPQTTYILGLDTVAFLEIVLRNKGKGEVKEVGVILLKQLPVALPEGFEILSLTSCSGATVKTRAEGEWKLEIPETRIEAGKYHIVSCNFEIPKGMKDVVEMWVSYPISVEVNYTYETEPVDAIVFVDPEAPCVGDAVKLFVCCVIDQETGLTGWETGLECPIGDVSSEDRCQPPSCLAKCEELQMSSFYDSETKVCYCL
jgi:hypothetical protein